MRKLFTFITLFLLSSTLVAQKTNFNNADAYLIESFKGSFTMVEVSTHGGSIEVIGGASSFSVEAYVRDNNKIVKSGTSISPVNIDVKERGSALIVEADRPRGIRNSNISVSFVVYVTDNVNTNLNTSGGHILISDISGDHELRTSGGHITINAVSGTIDGRTSGGFLNVSDFSGEIDLSTSGGHITMKNVEGDIDTKTSGGHIKFDNVAGKIRASTSGGNIDVSIGSINNGLDLRTSGGNITAELPQDDYDLDVEGSWVNAKLKDFNGRMDDDNIRGTVGKGGAKVNIETSGGIVNLRFREI